MEHLLDMLTIGGSDARHLTLPGRTLTLRRRADQEFNVIGLGIAKVELRYRT